MSETRCICCGNIIPEGRQVCSICANKSKPKELTYHGNAYSKDGYIYETEGNLEGVSAWVDKMAKKSNIYMAEMKVVI